MKKNKKTLIIVLAIVLFIILIGGIIAYMYFFTDVFKSDKQKFFVYAGKTVESVANMNISELNGYLENKNTKSYESNGTLKADMDISLAQKLMQNANVYKEFKKTEIVTNVKKDKQNNYDYRSVKFKYSNGENIDIEYLNKNDLYGISVNKIGGKYVAIENNKLKDLAQKVGITNTDAIPEKIQIEDLNKYKFSEEEIEKIKNIVYKILDENLSDTMFVTEKISNYNKYTITLTEAQAKEILNKLYNELINNEIIVNKLQQFLIEDSKLTETEAKNKIEELQSKAKEYKEKKEENENSSGTKIISISIYKTNKNVTKVEYITEDSKVTLNINEKKIELAIDEASKDGENTIYNPLGNISLEKVSSNDEFKYNIIFSLKDDNKDDKNELNESSNDIKYISLIFNLNIKGIQNADIVQENYDLKFRENSTDLISYTFNNTVDFNSNFEKEELESNSVKLNNYTREQLEMFATKYITHSYILNQLKMQKLGLNAEQNPIRYYFQPLFENISNFI